VFIPGPRRRARPTRRPRAAAGALAVAAALAASGPLAARGAPSPAKHADPLEQRREAIAREILTIAGALRGAIVRGDAATILERVPASGLRCGERVIPRARVMHDLRTPGTWLHEVFFGAGGTAESPRSLQVFLRGAREVAMVVAFRVDPAAGPVGRPCLDFRVKGVATPGAPLCFEQRAGRWWLVQSLYPCD
jgi:hypothetical protein